MTKTKLELSKNGNKIAYTLKAEGTIPLSDLFTLLMLMKKSIKTTFYNETELLTSQQISASDQKVLHYIYYKSTRLVSQLLIQTCVMNVYIHCV